MTPPLLAVTLVYRSKSSFSSLAHVIKDTSAFLDSSVELELRRAIRFNSTRLLDRIWGSSSPEFECSPADVGPGKGGKWSRRKYLRTDEHYNRYQFRFSMLEAVRQPGMEMIQWLYDHFYGCVVSNEVVECVAAQGNLKLLQFFYHHMIHWGCADGRSVRQDAQLEPRARHFVRWSGQDMAFAAKNGHRETLYWLHEHIEVRRDVFQLMQAAVTNGDIEILEWVQANFEIVAEHAPGLMYDAGSAGRIDVMEWLRSNGYVKDAHMATYTAAENGHMDVVNWLLKHKLVEAARAMDAAATSGHLEFAKTLYKRYWSRIRIEPHYPLEQPVVPHFLRKRSLWICGHTMLSAARNGHLDAVQWLFETFADDPDINLFDDEFPSHVIDAAAGKGHLAMVKYLHEVSLLMLKGGTKKRKRGRTLQGPGPTCTAAAMGLAAAGNYFDVVQWLFNNRSEGFTPRAVYFAASNGHFQMVQWLHAQNPEKCSSEAIEDAAQNGHLGVVKWLSTQAGIECTKQVMDAAASEGHLEVVKWLHSIGAGCTTEAMDGAARYGKLDMVKWLSENRTEGCTSDAMDLAAEGGHSEVVQWLHANRAEGCSTIAMDGAAACWDLDLVLFLHSQRNQGCTERAFDGTEEEGAENINDWLRDHYREHAPPLRDE